MKGQLALLAVSLILAQGQEQVALPDSNVEPAITGLASTSFFEYASSVAVQLIKENWQKVHVPDTSMQWSLPVVGPLTLTLSGIELHDLRFDGSKTGLVTSDQGTFVLTVEGLVAHVTCHFQYEHGRFPKFHGGGTALAMFSQGALQVEVAVQNDGSGHPQIASVGHVYMHFEDVDVQTFDAKLAWLYNIVLRLFDQYVKSAIESSVADQVTILVPLQVNNLLLGIPTLVKLHGFTLNTSLAGQPEVTADHLRVQDWGEFEMGPDEQCPYERSHGLQQAVMKAVAELLKGGSGASGVHAGSRDVSPQPARKLLAQLQQGAGSSPLLQAGSLAFAQGLDTEHSDSGAAPMLTALIDESVINCFTWVLWRQGKMQRHLSADQVPIALDTDSWASIVPDLAKKYPHQHMMLDAGVLGPLATTINAAHGIVSMGNATLSFTKAGNGTDGLQKLFSLQVSGGVAATGLTVEPNPSHPGNWRLKIHVRLLSDIIAVTVLESNVGTVRLEALQSSIKYLAGTVAETWINQQLLKDGFPLPEIPFIEIEKPDVLLQDHVVSVSADVRYTGQQGSST